MTKKDDSRSNTLRSLRERTEAMLAASAEPSKRDVVEVTPQEMQRIVHELQVHQIELETQNDELRRAQAELAFSRDRFNDLYDFAPVGYVTLDAAETIVECNLTLVTLFGIERKRMLGVPFFRYVVSDHQNLLRFHLATASETDAMQRCELMLRRGDGSTFPAQFEIVSAKDHASFALIYRIAIMNVTERWQAEEQLKASLRDKEVLLREIHHRVKNNLQIISSLVSLQGDTVADESARLVLADVRDRVHSMALVHERLYAADSLAALDFAEYASSLMDYLLRSHGNIANVKLTLAVQPIALPVGAAVHCGLMLNELVSNALKHGFPAGRHGEITVGLEREKVSGTLCLYVRDTGVGLPAGFDWRGAKSLGLRLVQMLARQLGGTVDVKSSPGTEFRVKFAIRSDMLAL
jgi:PAS domain S-box-containing protein